MPATILLKALGLSIIDILNTFYSFDNFDLSLKDIKFALLPERLRGELSKFDIKDSKNKILF